MSYIDENLSSGETVLCRTRLHWIAMLTHVLVGRMGGHASIVSAHVMPDYATFNL